MCLLERRRNRNSIDNWDRFEDWIEDVYDNKLEYNMKEKDENWRNELYQVTRRKDWIRVELLDKYTTIRIEQRSGVMICTVERNSIL